MLIITYQEIVSLAVNHTDFAIIDYYENLLQSGLYLYVKPLIAVIHLIMFIIVVVSIISDTGKNNVAAPPDSQQSP